MGLTGQWHDGFGVLERSFGYHVEDGFQKSRLSMEKQVWIMIKVGDDGSLS